MKKSNYIIIVVVVGIALVVGALWYFTQAGSVMRGISVPTDGATPVQVDPVELETKVAAGDYKTAVLAGGCFWCVESDLEKVKGVKDVVSGYSSGTTENPTYKNYGGAGHREVVLVTYDPETVTYGQLVEHVIKHGDPTDAEGSFFDRGFEYSPAVYYETEEEKEIAETVIAELDALNIYEKPIVFFVEAREPFWPAEDYHQNYYKENPIRYGYYRKSSGRDDFISRHWDNPKEFVAPINIFENVMEKTTMQENTSNNSGDNPWENFSRPSDAELKEMLTDIQYKVTQHEGTERAFSNEYWDNKADGIYVDIVSGEPLYSSTHKFDSGTGWPSFTQSIADGGVVEKIDKRFFMTRTEVRSQIADSHLGHVFNDAPAELGGIRHCINSAALRFIPKEKMAELGYEEYLSLFEE